MDSDVVSHDITAPRRRETDTPHLPPLASVLLACGLPYRPADRRRRRCPPGQSDGRRTFWTKSKVCPIGSGPPGCCLNAGHAVCVARTQGTPPSPPTTPCP